VLADVLRDDPDLFGIIQGSLSIGCHKLNILYTKACTLLQMYHFMKTKSGIAIPHTHHHRHCERSKAIPYKDDVSTAMAGIAHLHLGHTCPGRKCREVQVSSGEKHPPRNDGKLLNQKRDVLHPQSRFSPLL
jgi:hypothetical protein